MVIELPLKKEFLDRHNIRFQEDIVYEDVLIHIKAFLNASRMSFLREHVYHYRLSNPHSTMHDSSRIFDIIRVVDSVEEYLRQSSFFEEFELEFYIFKISQLYQYIVFWHIPEYFREVKNEFAAMKSLDEFDIDNLPEPHKSRFYKVLNSNSVDDI